jgi:hypothetical protein
VEKRSDPVRFVLLSLQNGREAIPLAFLLLFSGDACDSQWRAGRLEHGGVGG